MKLNINIILLKNISLLYYYIMCDICYRTTNCICLNDVCHFCYILELNECENILSDKILKKSSIKNNFDNYYCNNYVCNDCIITCNCGCNNLKICKKCAISCNFPNCKNYICNNNQHFNNCSICNIKICKDCKHYGHDMNIYCIDCLKKKNKNCNKICSDMLNFNIFKKK